MHIIYAKKFRFPNESANVIQALNMLAAFAACPCRVESFFSLAKDLGEPKDFLHAHYGRDAEKLGAYTLAPQGARGIRYMAWLARRIMSAEKAAAIYAREGAEVCRALYFRHLRMPALPVFYEVHKFDFDHTERRRREISRVLARVNGVVFVDQSLREQAVQEFGLNVPAYVAPAGVDLDLFGRRKAALPAAQVLVGYFGKMTEDKGVMLLAEALRFLPEHYRMRFVGNVSAQDKEQLLRIAGEAAPRIELRPKVSQAHLADALEGAHMSVIPIINEGQYFSPLKRAESLAMGLPLVCTPIPHLKHTLQDGKHAVFAESITPQALAKAIRTLGDSPALMERMQQENRAYAQEFSWEKRARNIVEFMREVMNNTRRLK